MKKFARAISILIILSAYDGLIAQTIDHWESILKTGMSVRYLVPDSNLPADWKSLDFDDSSWLEGSSGIGYGDGDDGTVIEPCISVFVRYKFQVSDPGVIEAMLLDMDYDDAFVAYLNGVEIARANMGASFSPTTYDQPADAYHEAGLFDGVLPERFEISPTVIQTLSAGENIFALEVHNENAGSSDLSSNAFLQAGINVSTLYFYPVPDWFEWNEPLTFSSELPVIVINTNGQQIRDDPRIIAEMGVIDNGPGRLNHPSDPFNDYSGRISIELRGASSQGFPKKSYTIETQTESGENSDVWLLGMPLDNDWVLYAPYSDKSLVRNVISYRLYENMGHWSPRTRFVDLYLNGSYNGIYVLTEKVKRGRFRVDIRGLGPLDVTDNEISGGYILQRDRTGDLLENEWWTSPEAPAYPGYAYNTFEYYDPEFAELTAAQASYIRQWINHLDDILNNYDYTDEINGYRPYIDVESFVDYLIFHEFNKDVDAYRLSAFYYKASIYRGGKLHAGPPWDYNLTYGNMDYGDDIRYPYNWMYPRTVGVYWWQRLIEDPWFQNKVYCRWENLKEDILNKDRMNHLIDSSISVIDKSIDYNFEQWPVLGVYVWPNNFIGDTHEEEIDFLKVWIEQRLNWIDKQWGGKCVMTDTDPATIMRLAQMTLSPNPSDLSYSQVHFPSGVSGEMIVNLYDINGRLVYSSSYFVPEESSGLLLDDLSYLPSGIYLLKISGQDGFTGQVKVIKN